MISKFEETWNYFKSGVKHFPQVIESRINKAKADFGKLSPVYQQEAERRLGICMSCPFNSSNAPFSPEYKSLFGTSYMTHRDQADIHCAICGCDLDYKVLGFTGACGLLDYNLSHPENKQELKWSAFYPDEE